MGGGGAGRRQTGGDYIGVGVMRQGQEQMDPGQCDRGGRRGGGERHTDAEQPTRTTAGEGGS